MWGKVQTFAQQGHRAVKNGLAHAHGMFQQGLHLAGQINDMYQVGKKMAAIALPHLDQYFPGALKTGVQAIGNIEHVRGQAQARFHDIQDQMMDHGRVFEQIRNQIPRSQPYRA